MLAVLVQEIMFHRIEPCRLVLIGYSGGGTLAMLLADHLLQTHAVVTVAANMSVHAWVDHHGYSPLTGSLDPAKRPPLDPNIFQLHLAGKNDQNIPPHLIQPVGERQSNAKFMLYENQDHNCCWERIWPSILTEIEGYSSECGD